MILFDVKNFSDIYNIDSILSIILKIRMIPRKAGLLQKSSNLKFIKIWEFLESKLI